MPDISYLVAAGFVGLIFKIMWDWLKGGRKMEHCESHSECVDRIEKCETCIQNIKKDQTRLSTLLTEHVIPELRKGSDRFRDIADGIAKTREDVAALTAIINNKH